MTTLDIRTDAETGVDIPLALAYLAATGITADVLDDEGVDPGNPDQIRDLVYDLLASAVAENAIADARQVCDLQAALDALTTTEQRIELDAMADVIRARMRGQRFTRTPARPPEPVYGGACLDAE